MSNSVLTQYKTKFTKALDFIVEDLRMSEDEVQELLTWMTKATRSRIFRPTSYADEVVSAKESDGNNFEAVFIPDLDDLDTKRPKEKKNETVKPAGIVNKPCPSKGSEGRAAQKQPPKVVPSSVAGRAKPTGSTKPPVPKLVGINTTGKDSQKIKAAGKAEKATSKGNPTAAATKTTPIKQVPVGKISKPVTAATKSSKPKN